ICWDSRPLEESGVTWKVRRLVSPVTAFGSSLGSCSVCVNSSFFFFGSTCFFCSSGHAVRENPQASAASTNLLILLLHDRRGECSSAPCRLRIRIVANRIIHTRQAGEASRRKKNHGRPEAISEKEKKEISTGEEILGARPPAGCGHRDGLADGGRAAIGGSPAPAVRRRTAHRIYRESANHRRGI